MYCLRYRKNCDPKMTETAMEQIEVATKAWADKCSQIFMPHMKTKGNTLKIHKFIAHFPSSIYRLGQLKHYHAQFYEALHRHTKALTKAGNFKADASGQTIAHMVKMQRRTEIATAMETEMYSASGEEKKEYQTAHTVATTYGVDAMIGAHTRVVWLGLETTGNQYTKCLPGQLKEWRFKAAVEITPHIRIYKSAIIRAVPWWKEDADFTVLQTVRACAKFHNKPWYDGVMYNTAGGQQYGILRCILAVELSNERAPSDGADPAYSIYKEQTQLALVQKLKTVRTSNLLTKHGCIHLAVEGLKKDGSGNATYTLIPLSEILRRVYLMSDFQKPKTHMYHNIWKWDRYVKDDRTLAELEGSRYRNGVVVN